jgi:hypothetical protein
MAFAFVVGWALSHGCGDDRARLANMVFFCNPSLPSADHDCGDGLLCYGAVQSLGGSICVPRCDPAKDGSCPRGVCTAGGECLQRCTVSDPKSCPPPLLCARSTVAPLESGSNDGVCLPVNSACTTDADCNKSQVFNVCTSSTNIVTGSPEYQTSGSVCAQGLCQANGVACEPGSSCIPDVIPASVGPPDVCAPDCVSRVAPSGATVTECIIGFSCLNVAFPQTSTRVCAPGFPGWLCTDQLGCVAGDCDDWEDVDLPEFFTCAPKCTKDEDCALFDRLGNPNFVSKMICNPGGCRNQQSLFFPSFCLKKKNGCALDPKAVCTEYPAQPDAGTPVEPVCNSIMQMMMNPDGGAPPLDAGSPLQNMPLGALGGTAAACQHACTQDSDCAEFAKNAHVPQACNLGLCLPPVPFAVPCHDGQACIGDLTCMDLGAAGKTCTRTCNSDGDCTGDAALGGAFACARGVCVPKITSGCSSMGFPQFCLSGQQNGNGICVSPSGWVCDSFKECASDLCVSGRCK